MAFISRQLESQIQYALGRGKSILLLGARQTGKTTLLQQFPVDLSLSFVDPRVKQRYERMPDLLAREVEALAEGKKTKPIVWIDEVQKIPSLLDTLQYLIDRQVAQFLLTGSSARKLRTQANPNWLPGRLVVLHLDPLTLSELESAHFNPLLESLLVDGTLPGIINTETLADKETDLNNYVSAYLEEEIRSEALVKKVAPFAKFLHLAAIESGQILNFRKLSQLIGVAHTTIATYYQILEDCLIIESIEPLTASKLRRRLTKTPKYLFFDLGVRRVSAHEGRDFPITYFGHLLEQWVGLELIRHLKSAQLRGKLYFWRDANGPEVDWVIALNNRYIPIEVKWTETPKYQDAKHLALFQKEYPQASTAWLICRTPRKMKLAENIYACSWRELIPAIFG
jgi:predicted AAA+ superfamily ATPase